MRPTSILPFVPTVPVVRRLSIAAAVIALTSSGACAVVPDTLSGSIEQSHDLTFETTKLELLTQQGAYVLSYLHALDGGGTDVVAKIVFEQPAGGAQSGVPIALDPAAGAAVQRVTANNEPFPDLASGSVTFHAGGNDVGATASGEFASTFDNGKTLNGTFEAVLIGVDF